MGFANIFGLWGREEKKVKDGSKGFGINIWKDGDDPTWETLSWRVELLEQELQFKK